MATYRYVLGVLRGANVFADYRQVAHEIRQHKGVRLYAMYTVKHIPFWVD
jgi:hypothetical protein